MNLLKEYAVTQMEIAAHNLCAYTQTGDEEVLHQLRVALKKCRAVMHYFIQERVHENKVRKLKKQLRIIFHTAGLIRLTQLRMQWVKGNRYRILLQNSSLENDLSFYTRRFEDDSRENIKILSAVKTKLVHHCSAADAASVLQYAMALKQSVQSFLKNLQQPCWHELRKAIKQLLYAYNWQLEKEKIKLLTVKEYSYFDELQHTIGIWHDAEDIKIWLSDEQFFLHDNEKVRHQFNLCWAKLMNQIKEKEKLVEKLLNNKKPGRSRASAT